MKKRIGTLILFLLAVACLAGLTACNSTDKEYSVLCQSAEHGRVLVADTSVQAGEKVILAAKPDVGYKLVSFVVDGQVVDGCAFVMPDKDVTVGATFECITYSITYVLGNATVAGNNPQTYTVESATELIAPQKEGYEICGWYTYCTQSQEDWDTDNWDIDAYKVTSLEGLFGNLTLYAKYYNPPHKIDTVDGENGWSFVEEYSYQAFCGETYTVQVHPDNGYELDYIAVNGERIVGTTFTMPACDVEITVEFKPIVYEITYVLFGGTNAQENPDTITVEDGYITLRDATKDGYAFYGWCIDEELTQFVYELNAYDYLDSPLTLYAYFVEASDDGENDW